MPKLTKKRIEYLRELYPIDTYDDLEYFDDHDRWLDDTQQQKDESGKFTIKYPNGMELSSDTELDKCGLVKLFYEHQ